MSTKAIKVKTSAEKKSPYEYEKYKTTKEGLSSTLNKYGVAIIPSILNEQECNDIVSGTWDFFEHITQTWDTPMDRDNDTSWKEIYKLFPMHSMLFQHWNIGHSQVCWDVRQNPKIVDIYSHLWKCENDDLLVSFDGLSFNIPPEITGRGWFRKTWMHSDQNFKRNGFECMQSWVTGLDVEENDATLSILEGSHKFHSEFQSEFQTKQSGDWAKLDEEGIEFYKLKGCERRNVMCPKGSLVCWDSRTIHCGVEASKTRSNPKFRSIIYTCYKPRFFATEKTLLKKQKAFEEMRMTSHWPCKIKLFPKTPRTWGSGVPETTKIETPVLSELGMKLAGY